MNDFDILKLCEPKSNQLNADDLIATNKTIKITDVSIGTAEQAIVVRYDGDNGKPWMPCKSMRRVLCVVWGTKASQWIGKSVTLYNDTTVKWAGVEVGGIRISHVSDISSPVVIALTSKKGMKKPVRIEPLTVSSSSDKPFLSDISKLIETAKVNNWDLDTTIKQAEKKYSISSEVKNRISDAFLDGEQ